MAEDNLISGFNKTLEEDQELVDENDPKKMKKIIIISIASAIIIAIIVIILVFTVFKSNSNSDSEGDKEEEDSGDKYSPSEIDTIPKEELDKARNAFKQYKYIDNVNKSYSLEYNLFKPTNYTDKKKYPLIIFIEDGSMVGSNKDIKISLTNSIGGPIWATDREQKKHECFVLSPQYNEKIIDDNNNRSYVSEYINVTYRLIQELISNYSIDSNKIYSTGQSMGAMTTLYFLANYPDFLAAGLVVDGQWRIDELYGLTNATFTYFAAGGDEKAFTGQTQVKEYLNSSNIAFASLIDLNAKDNVDNLNNLAKNMYNLKYSHNFITYKKGSVLPSNPEETNEHMASFKYGYRIDVVRDWLFKQIKCEEGTYRSEDGKCADANYCKVTNNDLSCKECLNGYHLTDDGESCTKVENCESGDKKNGECNMCIKNYYLDLQEKNCKNNNIDEKYKFCKIVDNGICIDCEIFYYISGDNKCTITQNCSTSENNICTKCQEGFYLGLDNKCSSVEKCIYSSNGVCNECENGNYFDILNDKCIESKDDFNHCKINSYSDSEKCALCKNDYYISSLDNLCYDNTLQGSFYKCEKSNSLGDKCISCIDGYYIGRIDSNCTKIKGCIQSIDENTCQECDEDYCMDNKGNCTDNYYIINEEMKFYYRCKKLNKEGTKCEICQRDLNTNEAGICFDEEHCDKHQNGKCIKCQDDNQFGYNGYCLNEEFGCVDSYLKHCIRCDNILEMDKCTQCEEGYEIDEYGKCILIETKNE